MSSLVQNSLIINNSAGNCSISIKFRTDFDDIDHVTPGVQVLRMFKVNGSKVKVANVSASKIVTCHEWIGWLRLNFVKIIPERSATRDTHVQGYKGNY